ncbi:hypothetical protein ABW19_dt0209845 [Dactylella cylindrospora]|nr:hypothetical protein ABW19_dt0209845 [Dactylella cylindrospora]
MAAIQTLPTELLCEIIEYLPRRHKFAFAGTCRKFYHSVTPVCYRNVTVVFSLYLSNDHNQQQSGLIKYANCVRSMNFIHTISWMDKTPRLAAVGPVAIIKFLWHFNELERLSFISVNRIYWRDYLQITAYILISKPKLVDLSLMRYCRENEKYIDLTVAKEFLNITSEVETFELNALCTELKEHDRWVEHARLNMEPLPTLCLWKLPKLKKLGMVIKGFPAEPILSINPEGFRGVEELTICLELVRSCVDVEEVVRNLAVFPSIKRLTIAELPHLFEASNAKDRIHAPRDVVRWMEEVKPIARALPMLGYITWMELTELKPRIEFQVVRGYGGDVMVEPLTRVVFGTHESPVFWKWFKLPHNLDDLDD